MFSVALLCFAIYNYGQGNTDLAIILFILAVIFPD
jgi:hypothetical protein